MEAAVQNKPTSQTKQNKTSPKPLDTVPSVRHKRVTFIQAQSH